MRFSLSEFLSDTLADVTTINFDMPGSSYDRLHTFIARQNILPEGKAGRTAVVAVMLAASRLVKQQLGTLGPFTNFVTEIGQDAVREEAKRFLENATHSTATVRPRRRLEDVANGFVEGLFPWTRGR